MTEEAQNFDYATEADLPVKQNFTTTRKAGYVEDEVDVWQEDIITRYTTFLNKYNELVYALNVATANTPAPVVEDAVADIEVTEEAPVEEAVETPVEAPAAPEPTPVTVVDTSSASRRAREIMDEAAAEAAEHVSRALDRVGRIEAEAIAEASDIVADAQFNGSQLVSDAELKARSLIENAVEEANAALELKNIAVEERDAILSRMELFYFSQLEEIRTNKGSLGYTPLLSLGGEVINLSDQEERPVDPMVYSDAVAVEPVTEPAEEAVQDYSAATQEYTPAVVALEDADVETHSYEAPVASEPVIPTWENPNPEPAYTGYNAPQETFSYEEPVEENTVSVETTDDEANVYNALDYTPPSYTPPTYGDDEDDKK